MKSTLTIFEENIITIQSQTGFEKKGSSLHEIEQKMAINQLNTVVSIIQDGKEIYKNIRVESLEDKSSALCINSYLVPGFKICSYDKVINVQKLSQPFFQ